MSKLVNTRAMRGFTLLEMLVALSIFALLAVMAYGGLASVLDLRASTESQAGILARVQKAYLVMQRDIEQIVARPVRDEFGDELPPLLGDRNLEFTRGGWSNPLGRPRSTLQRVSWSYQDRELVRYAWWALDRAQDSLPVEQLLLDEVEDMQVRYLVGKDVWKEQWPEPYQDELPDAAEESAGQVVVRLPAAVEVSIEHAQLGEIVWLFRVPQ